MTTRTEKAPTHLRSATRGWYESVLGKYDLEPHDQRLLQAACEAWDRLQEAREVLFELPFALAEAPFRNDPSLTTKPQFNMTRIGRGVLQVTVPADQPLQYMHWTGGASLIGTWDTRTAPVSEAILAGGPAEAFRKPATLKSGVTCTSGNYRPQGAQPI